MNIYQNELVSETKCRCCTDKRAATSKRKKGLRRPNPVSANRVLQDVTSLLDAALADKVVEPGCYITKEAVATLLNVPESFVAHAFAKLNQAGRLSQGSNIAPHDSTRDIWDGHDSAWAPTRYRVLR